MTPSEPRFPTLSRLLVRADISHMWKELLLETERYPGVLDNFASVLLIPQETILTKLETSSPSRWPRKRRDFISQNDEYRQLDLRIEFVIAAKLLTLNTPVEFEAEGSTSSPDIQVLGFPDGQPLFVEVTARTERDPEVLQELGGIFQGRFSTSGTLTETLDQYIEIIHRVINVKSEQSRRNNWSTDCMLIIDISRYGISWIRDANSWAHGLSELEIDWNLCPFSSISIMLSELTSTDLKLGTIKNPQNSELMNEKVDLMTKLISLPINII